MNATNSGSPFAKFSSPTMNRVSLWDVITYAFESRSSEKMWVRAFLYAAIWSLEDGPGNNVNLPISPISPTHRSGLLKCRRSRKIVFTAPMLTHTRPIDDRRARTQTPTEEKSENYANRVNRKDSSSLRTHTGAGKSRKRHFADIHNGADFREVEKAIASVWVRKYFQFS
jgi:hypothetical protein